MNYNFNFRNYKEASLFVERAREIAKEYGRVTLSDLYDLSGYPSCYAHHKISWPVYSVTNNVHGKFNSDLKCYTASFPEPFLEENKPQSNVTKKELANSLEPINITIYVDSLEDPFETVHQIFDMANEIKDRPIFITIS